MKKILYIAGLVLFLVAVFCATCKAQEELGLRVATQKWAVACSTYPLPKTFSAINLFVCAEKNNGNYSSLDRVWVLGVGLASSALTDIINQSTATAVNSPTFTAYQGYVSNGTSSYLNTNFKPSTNGVNYVLNSASLGVWSRSNITNAGTVEIGGYTTINIDRSVIEIYFVTDGKTYTGINSLAGASSAMGTPTTGLYTSNRANSTQVTIWRNGASSGNITLSSDALTAANIYVCAEDHNGTAATFSSFQIAFVYFGSGSLSQANLYTDVNKLSTLLGW